ncbi:lysylphosphatidylglycerol synthase transmembrane domain-containing protein [Orenia marismortui]|uniref:lysylphosphatidylglycerol synthase transmembrane domain-containing protein n=1 Tax=Orenia marismortui TaxID=46469 RepID=UPI00036E9BC4|nr:lysylphosphatidylglycerol synthase transmembrane domain-containing protein [Orenia marismortui]
MSNISFNKKKIIKVLLQLLVSSLLIFVLLRQIQMKDFIELLKKVRLSTIVLGLSFYLLIYVFRTLRFKVLLSKKIGFFRLINILLVHGFFNRAMPLRLGELSYIYLMKNMHDIDVSESTFAILYVRLYDLLSTVSIFIIFSLIILSSSINVYIYLLILGLLLTILLLFPKIINIIYNLLQNKGLPNFIEKFISKERILSNIENVYKLNKKANSIKNIMKMFTYSIGVWSCFYIIFYFLIIDFGYNINLSKVILGATFSNLTSILPVSGLGNFGTMEAGWTLGFMMMGYPKNIAIMTGFGVNLFTFSSILIFGSISIIILLLRKNIIIKKERGL